MTTMKVTLAVVAAVAVIGVALWGFRSRGPAAPLRERTVAFDNTYGKEQLRVHVSVDRGSEQTLTAACDPTTCTFKLPLTNARHELTLAVELNGQRSAPTTVTVDTRSNPR
jgi:hypothetical protein